MTIKVGSAALLVLLAMGVAILVGPHIVVTDGLFRYGYPLGALLIIGIVLVLWLIFIHERFVPEQFEGKYWREDPEPDLSPALVGAIWREGVIEPEDFSATILQLIDKDVIQIVPGVKHQKNSLGLKKNYFSEVGVPVLQVDLARCTGLDLIDQQAIDLLGSLAEKSDAFDYGTVVGESEDILKSHGEEYPDLALSTFDVWVASVKAMAEGVYLKNRPVIVTIVLYALRVLICFGVLLLFVASSAADKILSWPALISAGVALIFTVVFDQRKPRRTSEGRRLYHYYQGIYEYLKDFSRLQDYSVTSVEIWNRYLVLATVFGIADEVAFEFNATLPKLTRDFGFQPDHLWYYSGGHGGSPQSFNSVLISAVRQVAGGGFGGGGGGGAR
ncbi:MAG: DUF2207 domain-containing protein [Coriobacteriia bacterium]|nr:DUF2207 domain-containing protein [Coriobacteriia bacterium]